MDHYFEQFLAFFVPEAHAEIDWGRGYEMLDREFQKIIPESEQGRRVVDKLVKVWLKPARSGGCSSTSRSRPVPSAPSRGACTSTTTGFSNAIIGRWSAWRSL